MSIDSHSYASNNGAGTILPQRKIIATGSHGQLVAITIPAGSETGEEMQHGSDLSVFVAEGKGEAVLNGHSESAGQRDAIFIPAGTVYRFKNSGVADLRIFVTYSPPAVMETATRDAHSNANFYAIARPAEVTDESDEQARQAFPAGIKWTSWKRPALTNVLFATDFSPASYAALPFALSLARHYRSKLLVAHIIVPDVSGLIAPQLIDRIRLDLNAAAMQKLEELVRSISAGDLAVEPIIAEGAIAEMLVATIRAQNVDLIVLGTQGRRGLRKLVLGSVAEEIFRLAPCPVLTVGPKAEEAAFTPLDFNHIVYPMELTGNVVKAAGYAISIAKEYGAELTFLNVIEEATMSGAERAWMNATAAHWFEDKIVPDLEIAKTSFAQKFGDLADAILQCAEEKRADLIVMNIEGSHTVVGGLVPAVAHRVVAEATCPVLTIR